MVLEIEDPNIIFTQDAVIEEIRGAKALVFYAELKLQPGLPCLWLCQQTSSLWVWTYLHTYTSYSYRPTYIKLSRQRFRCELCRSVFSEWESITSERVAPSARQMVCCEAFSNCPLTDIARRFHLADRPSSGLLMKKRRSITTIKSYGSRSIWLLMSWESYQQNELHLGWWRSTPDWRNSTEPDGIRNNEVLWRLSTQCPPARVQNRVSLDLNAGYINLVPRLFPNAKIVVDRFHIVQMVSTALNMVRIQVMKGLSKRSKEYRFMKREWKIFLKDFNELEAIKPTYHTSVGYYETTVNLVAKKLRPEPGVPGSVWSLPRDYRSG